MSKEQPKQRSLAFNVEEPSDTLTPPPDEKLNQLPDGWERWEEERLTEEIIYHNQRYWDDAAPEISDYDYDRLVEALRQRAPEASILNALGPSIQGIGAPVEHQRVMLSLEKCYEEEGLLHWARKGEGPYLCSPKVDGVACSLRYDVKGRLTIAATRGNGRTGEDITQNVFPMESVPKQLSPPPGEALEIRGEIYMPLSAFARCQEEFANPRNATAGTLKQKNRQRAGELGLRFFAYDVDGLAAESLSEAFAQISAWGFEPVPAEQLSIDGLQEAYEGYVARRDTLDYEIDGVCFRLDNRAAYREKGETSHHPRGAIAYKLQGESAKTTLRAIEWGVSRNRILTPVGIVEPVRLSGAMVSRITLHSWGMLQRRGLSLGAEVVAMRRGGVIPHLEAVVRPGEEEIHAPSQCPQCPTREAPTRVDGDLLLCAYEGRCEAQSSSVLSHFVRQMGIEGFGTVWLETLTKAGILESPVDLYRLKEIELLKLPRVKEGRARSWLKSINASREVPLATFLTALGVPELGRRAAERLSEAFGTLSTLRSASVETIAELPNFAEQTATMISEGLAARATLIDALLSELTVLESEPQDESHTISEGEEHPAAPFTGMKFLFTATLAAMKRAEAERRVKALGGTVASSVSASLSALIVGSEGRAGSKLKRAESLQRPVWSEEDFLRRLREGERAHGAGNENG